MMITITGLDLETTGLEADKGHRITEIGMTIHRFDTDTHDHEQIKRISVLINPKRDIPPIVQDITGITPAMVKDKKPWEDLAPAINKAMMATDLFIAHNAEFDYTFLSHELDRVGLQLNPKMAVLCTMESGRFATPLGKPPRLEELCWALEVDFNADDAHRAIYDTDKMMEAFFIGVDQGYYDLTEVLDEIAAHRLEAA